MKVNIGLYRFEFRTIPVIVTLLAFAILARLGFWQLARGEQKVARLAQIAEYQQLGKLSFADLESLRSKVDPTGVSVSLTGQFARPQSWLLDNKTVNGQPGYDVALAFKPQGTDKHVLVNMGWLKGNYANRAELPEFDIPEGRITLDGYVKAKDLASFALSEQSDSSQPWPKRVPQVNLETFTEHSGLALHDFLLIADNSEQYGFVHHYQPVVMAPEKHRGYALQWFSLALAVLIVFIFASKRTDDKEDDKEKVEKNNERS